jgi:exodeoxyribonuclease VII small subunit
MSKKKSTHPAQIAASHHQNSHFDFESSLNELENLVDALEKGELSLEQSLQDFERGIHLTRTCQSALNEAQQKIQILVDQESNDGLHDYQPPSNQKDCE